jgi:hypothetical protein
MKYGTRDLAKLGMREGIPLNLKLQHRMDIPGQLQNAGGSMSMRQLFNRRRFRAGEKAGLWRAAMFQLIANGFIQVSGTGVRHDAYTVTLVKPLPENEEAKPEQSTSDAEASAERLASTA